MAITDYKIRNEEFSGKDIVGLPDKPSEAGMSAAALKERFDAGSKKVVGPKVNALIDELVGIGGAGNIGAAQIPGLSGYNVQDILAAVKVLLDTKQSIEQSNIDVNKKFDKTEAQALVKTIVFNEKSGVFTITKYDGTMQTIDTALEKVALNVRLDGQQFVLTLVDGTEQRVDLSAFLTQAEIKSSNTISLTEESGVIVAKLINGSVEKEHLSTATLVYLEDKESSAAASAAEAAVQASNALASANAAAASQQSALECAENACKCSSDADISAQEAAASASSALSSAQNANDSAERAKQAADRAEEVVGGDFATRNDLENHVNNKENPHGVTREQIGAASAAALSAHTADTTNPHKTTAEQVGAVRTYQSPADLGIETPYTFDKLFNAAANYTHIEFSSMNNVDFPEVPTDWGGLSIIKTSTSMFIQWRSAWNLNNGNKLYIGTYRFNAGFSGWQELANAADYLPLDGSKAMTGDLIFYTGDGIGKIRSDYNGIILQTECNGTPNAFRALWVRPACIMPLEDSVNIFDNHEDGSSKNYRIFGEHNTALLASTIEKLIANGRLSTLDNAIGMVTGDITSNAPFTGTGRGMLFFRADDSFRGEFTIVIDGKSLGKVENDEIANSSSFGFLNSFSVSWYSASGQPSNSTATAVYY